MEIKNHSREINVDARVLLSRLKAAKVGDVVTYAELSELVGRDVQKTSRYILEAARRWAKKERVIFGVVTGQGLKRLDDIGKVRAGSGMMDKIRRTSRRAAQTLASVENFDSLPNDMKIQHNMSMSIFGVIQQATSRKTQDRIAEKVSGSEGGVLAMKKSFELFV
jgi:hypothetical protein